MPKPLNFVPKHRPDYACGECGEIGHNAVMCPKALERRHEARKMNVDQDYRQELERQLQRTRGLLDAPTPPIPREKPKGRVDLSYLRQPAEETK